MSAMVTVLATAVGLVVLGAREAQEIRARRAGRRRLRALAADDAAWALQQRIRELLAD